MSSIVTQATATAEEISNIADHLEMVLEGTPTGHAIIAMLSTIILLQHPTVTPDELQLIVSESSRFICMMLEGTGIDPEDVTQKLTIN